MDAADIAGSAPEGTRPEAPDGRGAAPTTPTPVRAVAAPLPAPPEAGRSATDAELRTGDERWTVRVLGRSVSGPSSARTPFLLLGFFDADEPSEPRREALVVGRDLADLTESELLTAWHAGRVPRPSGERKPFFGEIAGKRGKEG